MNRLFSCQFLVVNLNYLIIYNLTYMHSLVKTENQYSANVEPTCKKIQNYIFKFADLLGKGNFSKVYKAHNQVTNEIVAIKIIQLNSLKSKKLQQLLFSEIQVLKKLSHPNILKCFQVFTSNRNCYIITQLCNGGDLQSKLRKQHHFTQVEAMPIIKDIFLGLYYLAEKNVIHRDLKVANIFLHNGRVKIADFGFAKFTKQKFKDINIGSPIYMSPQGLINNYYGPKTDIWAFGVLIFELLHGQTPYAFCQTQSQLKYHISIPISWNKLKQELSNDLKQLIMRCMEVSEQKRITAFQLKNHPFIKKCLDRFGQDNGKIHYSSPGKVDEKSIEGSSRSPYKYSNFAETRSRRNVIGTQKEKKHSPMSIHEHNRNMSNKNIKKVETNSIGMSYQRRGVSAEKFSMLRSQDSALQKRVIDSKSNIISTSLTFKECVNLLHYCRLIYKYITSLKNSSYADQKQIGNFTSWLMFILKEVNNKIQSKDITYEGDNVWIRQKKLKEVANQYTKKYTSDLGQHIHHSTIDLTLSSVKQYVYSIYENYDSNIFRENNNKSLLVLGHSILMIYDCTYILKKCYDSQNYKSLSQYKDVQTFLNMNKDSMDMQSYLLYRKKLSFDRN